MKNTVRKQSDEMRYFVICFISRLHVDKFQTFVNSYDIGCVPFYFATFHCLILFDVEGQKIGLSSSILEREDSELPFM